MTDPSKYFTASGDLLAATLTDDVIALGPLDGDGRSSDRRVISARLAELLGDRYRRSYVRHVEEIVRGRLWRARWTS